MTQPNLRLDELKRLAEQEDLGPFVTRAVALHPSDLVRELPSDDAADIIGDLAPEDREAVLAELADRGEVEQLLRYPKDTAGGLMTTEAVAVREGVTLAEALDEIRRQREESDDLYQVYVVDGERRLQGVLPIARLVVAAPSRRASEIMEAGWTRMRTWPRPGPRRCAAGSRPRAGQAPTRGMLGLVVLLAMTGNLLVAGFVGAFIPISLQRFGIDPAVASSVFVTALTDVCGFLLLLGLGTTLLL